MARKKLLSEGEIRQFMKLANLRPIGRNRLSEYGMPPGARDEDDELRDELDATEDELGDEDALADEEGDELDAMGDDLAMDDAGGGDMVSMDDFMSALERAIEEVTGEEADVSEEPGDEEVEMDAAIEMGPEGDEEEIEMEMGPEEMMEEIVRRIMEKKDKDYGHGKHEYKRSKDAKGRESKTGEGKDGHYKDYEGPSGGNKGDKSKTRPGHTDYEGDDDQQNEGMADATAGAPRRPRMQRRGDDEGFGAVGGMMDEPSELEPGTEYDPSEKIPRSKRGPRRRTGGVGIPGVTSEQVVNEVAKRVAARLKAENNREQMVDHLAERIMKRLTK